jgi:FHS family Na+ dependent glucose MFS transporter 1
VGLAVSFLGPSLTHLQGTAHVSVQAVSILFSAQALGYLFGSLVAAPGVDRRVGHLVLVGALVVMGISVALVPFLASLVPMAIVFVLIGTGAGAIDVAANTLLMWSRRHAVGPYMNALHLAFGVGALAAPILVGMSLTSSDSIGAPCAVTAVVCLLAAGWVMTRQRPESPMHEPASTLTTDLTTDLVASPAASPPAGLPTDPTRLAVISGFFLLYVGLEVGAAGWLFAYAQAKHLGDTRFAALLTTAFWGAFTLGRLLSVALIRSLTATQLLVGAASLAVVASAALALTGAWAGATLAATVVLGLALAPQYPTMMTLAGQHLHLTGRATAWFIGASAAGGLVLPWLIGQLFGGIGAGAMPVAVLATAVLTLGWIALILRVLAAAPTITPDTDAVGSAIL